MSFWATKFTTKTVLLTGFLAVGLSQPVVVSAGEIYKTTYANGTVQFTDQAPINPPAGTKVEVIGSKQSTTNTFQSDGGTSAAPRGNYQPWIVDGAGPVQNRQNTESEEPPKFPGYSSFAITSPSNDESVRSNPGNITVSAKLSPDLQPGHQIHLLLDGRKVESSTRSSIGLANVDRGSHRAVMVVEDANGVPMIASDPVTFHMLRASRPQPQAR